MRKLYFLFFLTALMSGCITQSLLARQTVVKDSSEIKLEQEARKEVGRLEKEGWRVYPGSAPMEKQLINAWSKEYAHDTAGFPLWITSYGSCEGPGLDEAYMNAGAYAIYSLAGLVAMHMTNKVQEDCYAKLLSAKDAFDLVSDINGATEVVLVSTGNVEQLLKIYRTKGDKTEVLLRVASKYTGVREKILEQLKDLMHMYKQIPPQFQKYLKADYYGVD